ncbi:MAG: tetratricopeptide repeat protein [Thermoanaerobaculia bacterium]
MPIEPEIAEHPRSEALEAFLRMEDPTRSHGEVETHLRRGCLRCQLQVYRILRVLHRKAGADQAGAKDLESRVRRGYALFHRHEVLATGERRLAPYLRERLRTLTWERQQEAVHRQPEFQLYTLADLLTDEARAAAIDDVSRTLDVARLAVAVAEEVGRVVYPPGLAADARCRAASALGNAHRVRAELREAERAFATARAHLEDGEKHPADRAEYLSLLGSLRLDQARFGEAVEVLEEAAGLYQQVGDRTGEGKALLKLGRAAGEAAHPTRAVRFLEQAEEILAAVGEDRFRVYARHSQAHWLTEAGRAWEAMALFRSSKTDFQRHFRSPSEAPRIPWLAGKIYEGLGQLDLAEEQYEVARNAFWDDQLRFYFVVATLDRVAVLLELGRTEEVKRLAEELVPVFRSCDLPKEAAVALVYFQRAVLTESATVRAVRELATYLRRARTNPDLPYPAEGS